MNTLIFKLPDAGDTWYVWPSTSPQLYSFGSNVDAMHFAKQLGKYMEAQQFSWSDPSSKALR